MAEERCLSIYSDEGTLFQCERDSNHENFHISGDWTWKDSAAINANPRPTYAELQSRVRVLEEAMKVACYDLASEFHPELHLGDKKLQELADELMRSYMTLAPPAGTPQETK